MNPRQLRVQKCYSQKKPDKAPPPAEEPQLPRTLHVKIADKLRDDVTGGTYVLQASRDANGKPMWVKQSTPEDRVLYTNSKGRYALTIESQVSQNHNFYCSKPHGGPPPHLIGEWGKIQAGKFVINPHISVTIPKEPGP